MSNLEEIIFKLNIKYPKDEDVKKLSQIAVWQKEEIYSMLFPKPIKKTKGRKKLLPRSKNPRKTAHRRAWAAISLWVRLSNADPNGYVKCFTCGTAYHYKEMDAGHFIHRDSLDFEEYNIHPQCVRCNQYLSGNLIEYTLRMISLYGQEVVNKLMIRKNEIVRYGIADFLEIEAKYKQKLEELGF